MMNGILKTLTVRRETPEDYPAVYELTKAAFAGAEYSDGDEQDVVEQLRKRDGYIPELSLVAESDGRIAGHILFTEITVGGNKALCLGPVSVLPEFHRQGIGGALIRKGHEAALSLGFSLCVLVGHRDYYPRFGYELISGHGITFPFDAPDDCCMVKFLDSRGRSVKGAAVFPPELVPENADKLPECVPVSM